MLNRSGIKKNAVLYEGKRRSHEIENTFCQCSCPSSSAGIIRIRFQGILSVPVWRDTPDEHFNLIHQKIICNNSENLQRIGLLFVELWADDFVYYVIPAKFFGTNIKTAVHFFWRKIRDAAGTSKPTNTTKTTVLADTAGCHFAAITAAVIAGAGGMKHCIGIGHIILNWHIRRCCKLQSGCLNGCRCRIFGRSGWFRWSQAAARCGCWSNCWSAEKLKMCNVVGCCSHWLLHRGKRMPVQFYTRICCCSPLFWHSFISQKNRDLRWQQFPQDWQFGQNRPEFWWLQLRSFIGWWLIRIRRNCE